jgi:hypothetical protein
MDAVRASEALLTAAERDAGEIVACARAQVQQTILKAQQELLALNAQVRTTMERLEGRDYGLQDGRLPAASRVLREAHAQLEALSIEPRAMGVVVAHAPVQHASTAAALSPYEMENARVRVRVPARAARGLRVAPLAAVLAAAALFAGAWAWTRGWLPLPQTTAAPSAPKNAAADHPPGDAGSEATGMIGRSTRGARGDKPERSAPADRTPVRSSAAASPSRGVPPAESTTSPADRQQLLNAAEGWLDAYYRQDSGRMSALSSPAVTLTDERTPEERLPSGLIGVRRTLGDATVQVFGSDAILTAKVVERSDAGGRESASFISQMWSRRGGAWQVTDVRIVSAAAVARAFRR